MTVSGRSTSPGPGTSPMTSVGTISVAPTGAGSHDGRFPRFLNREGNRVDGACRNAEVLTRDGWRESAAAKIVGSKPVQSRPALSLVLTWVSRATQVERETLLRPREGLTFRDIEPAAAG